MPCHPCFLPQVDFLRGVLKRLRQASEVVTTAGELLGELGGFWGSRRVLRWVHRCHKHATMQR